ncbi:MAG: toxic anion resistance protein [Lachnospiraceae bacterium]|nr:toxic anion resistance protein [Lachnospiraceae bacterium]
MTDKISLELEPAADTPVVETTTFSAITAPEPDQVPVITEDGELQNVEYMYDVKLTEEEQQMVDEFAEKIDLENTSIVLNYGAASQKKIADFSDNALKGVKSKDLGEVGTAIADLVTELKGFSLDEPEKKGIAGWFKKKVNSIVALKERYDTAEANVNKITGVLEGHQNQLTTDVVMLDKMYDSNLVYFKELTMYIIAGKKKLEKERSTKLVELKKKAEESGLAEDAQAANDYAALCDRFEKKLHDLELTRTVSMQMAPQIRLIQNSDSLMVEKIQSTISNTIPLWKNQMVLALGMAHSEEAMNAQKEVNQLTNDLLRKNAETLKQGSIEIAEESEKGLIDIETVKYANEQLITSLDEVVRIQEEGREKRRLAENELAQIEATLKQKLLDIRTRELEEIGVPNE